MPKLALIAVIVLLSACGSQPVKPTITHQMLVGALLTQDVNRIINTKNQLAVGTKNDNIIKLYLLAINEQPYELISNSQILLQNIHHYDHHQQGILKPLLLWAYAHPIYRQETAKQVRLLQRETLLVAPSDIDFKQCEADHAGCANGLRAQVAHIISPNELTEVLSEMAHNDPCINLSDENLGGDFGNQCLASRKGDLKINLLSKPSFLSAQWQALFNNKP